jgi:uncharacterized protein
MTEFISEPLEGEDDHPGRSIDERYQRRVIMNVPGRGNPRLARLIEIVNADDDLYGLWLAANVTAIERLGMTDHGPVHVKIVMNMAVKILRTMVNRGITPSVVENYEMEPHDAEVIVALGALFHDLGMSVHRKDHEAYSLFVAQDKLREILPQLYEPRQATVIRSEVLHAIIAHRKGGQPLTLEAGVVRIADALDMAKGRSRIPFEQGSDSIHSVSAAAIDRVKIEKGKEKAVCITVVMTNSAGIFQLDQLFRQKLRGSGLEPHLELRAVLAGEAEETLFKEFRI